ncbi:DUF3078 domain-containing protein [Salinimicrobium soli]|uniref:DUF3078 domain-containing protein n=1 Tax=Salinimicrobium soli TaxID=1254399 RepID=UPI003AADB330
MKKYLLSLFSVVFFVANLSAQEEEEKDPEGWNSQGKFQLLFNQSAFNEEWRGGGTSSIAGNLSLDYQLNYRKGSFSWDNKLLANYGLTKQNGDEFTRKTSDRLELNSIAGKELNDSNWYYSFFTNFRTQLTKGYVYSENKETGETLRTETTHFLSPAFLQFGPGMMWKKNENLIINIAPATARFILVDDAFTTTPGYKDGSYYGVDQGKSSRFELGASISGYALWEIVENVKMENTLNLYSNYLENPENVDIDYLMNLEMSINKFLTANLIFQAIYDDNTIGAFQIREVFGAGFNYTF